jgi:hypothetical protein
MAAPSEGLQVAPAEADTSRRVRDDDGSEPPLRLPAHLVATMSGRTQEPTHRSPTPLQLQRREPALLSISDLELSSWAAREYGAEITLGEWIVSRAGVAAIKRLLQKYTRFMHMRGMLPP